VKDRDTENAEEIACLKKAEEFAKKAALDAEMEESKQ